MINQIPKGFKYNESTQNLFLFYQRVSELLFDHSPDTYKLSALNTHSLCLEAKKIYSLLQKDHSTQRFYSQYIPDILDELIFSLKKDYAARDLLGLRYERYTALLKQCRNLTGTEKEISLFETTINNLLSQFANKRYYNALCEEILQLIGQAKDQQKLISLTDSLLRELVDLGYSKQHIYNVVHKFFKSSTIDNPNTAFKKLMRNFDFEKKEWEIITFVHEKICGYYSTELHKVIKPDSIELLELTNEQLQKIIEQDESFVWLQQTLHNLKSARYSVSLIDAKIQDYDPYSAYRRLEHFFDAVNEMVTLFDNEVKLGYPSIACLNYRYKKTITFKSSMEKRPHLKAGEDYAHYTTEVLAKMHMSQKMFSAFFKTAKFHNDALSKTTSDKYALVILWTALESLFVYNSDNTNKAKLVQKGLISIIQRTYITKVFKYLQYDLLRQIQEVGQQAYIKKYNLNDLKSFILIMYSPDDSEAVKEIETVLEKNMLLRSRIFQIVGNQFKTNACVETSLKDHQQKIEWQIKRIYRSRNLIVHTGQSLPYTGDLVENIHNYVDFVINFIICKSWNSEMVLDIESLIAEVELDNDIHLQMLHKEPKQAVAKSAFRSLFGPSTNVVDYYSNFDV